MNWRRALFSLSIGILLCGPSAIASGPATGEVWTRPWVDATDTTLREEHLNDLLAIAQKDPEVVALLNRFGTRIGIDATQAKALLAVFSLCTESKKGGEATQTSLTYTLMRAPDGSIDPELRATIPQQARLSEDLPLYQIYRMSVDCPSCLSKNQNLRDAYNTFVHEIVHLTEGVEDDRIEEFLRKYPDAQSYISNILNRSGGEYMAYTLGTRAAIRASGYQALRAGMLDRFFNAQGELVNKRSLREAVNDRGYAESIRQDYLDRLQTYLQLNAHLRTQLAVAPSGELLNDELKRLDALDARLKSVITKTLQQ